MSFRQTCVLSHLLRTGAIRDLVIVSERQIMKGMSRVIAVTGQDATKVNAPTFCFPEAPNPLPPNPLTPYRPNPLPS